MDKSDIMVIYNQWPYMTMLGTFEVVLRAVGEGIQTDRLLFEKGHEEQAILQENCALPVYFQMGVQGLVIVLDSMTRITNQIEPYMFMAAGYPVFACGRAAYCG
jgi:hypothetical protein